MRFYRILLIALSSLLFPILASAQDSPPRDPLAAALLQRAHAALAGGQVISDVTVTGTARRVAGSDDEVGTAILKALAAGASRVDHAFSSGQRREVWNASANPPSGSWSGPDGVDHATSLHNLMGDPTWFFPAFLIGRVLSSTRYVAVYAGHEARDSVAVEHLTISQKFGSCSEAEALVQQLSHVEIYLDSGTLLPVALTFNVHSDDDAGLNIPVEIRFSDYRPVSGTQTSFHIRKFVNNGLVLELQFKDVTLNSGLSASSFDVR